MTCGIRNPGPGLGQAQNVVVLNRLRFAVLEVLSTYVFMLLQFTVYR